MFLALEIVKSCRFIALGLMSVFIMASSGLADDRPGLTGVDNMALDCHTFSKIVDACTSGQYDSLARFYYGDALFFPDLILAYAVFVLDPAVDIRPYKGIVLEKNCKDMKHILYGDRAVYPWVFMVVPAETSSGRPDSMRLIRNPRDSSLIALPEQVVVRHSQYAQQPDPGIAVFSFLAKTLSGVGSEGLADAAKAADKIDTLDFHEIIPVNCENCPVKHRLFLARGKVNLESQTVNGLSVRLVNPSSSDMRNGDDSSKARSTPAKNSGEIQWPKSAEWSVLYSKSARVRFANYREFPFGVGLGLALSKQEVNDTSRTEAQFEDWELKNTDVDLFLLLHGYLIRPHWPRLPGRGPTFSLALSAGVKVDFDNFPQDFFLGLSFGDFWYRHLQFSAGINFPVFELSDGKKRKGEFMLLLSVRMS